MELDNIEKLLKKYNPSTFFQGIIIVILKQKLENSACVARLPVLHRKCLSSDDSVGPHSRILFLLKKTPVQNPAVIFAAAFNFMSKVSKTKIDCGHLESNCASKWHQI